MLKDREQTLRREGPGWSHKENQSKERGRIKRKIIDLCKNKKEKTLTHSNSLLLICLKTVAIPFYMRTVSSHVNLPLLPSFPIKLLILPLEIDFVYMTPHISRMGWTRSKVHLGMCGQWRKSVVSLKRKGGRSNAYWALLFSTHFE